MTSDPMLDDLRKALWPQPHAECPDSWADCNLARGFIRTHGPALLAKLEAMEKDALACVRRERERQDAKWGEQNHEPFLWMTILGEEFGEACKAALEATFNGEKLPDACLSEYRVELVQTAAVAVAAIESLDRARGQS